MTEIIPGAISMVELQCKNHPKLRWHTKNIAPIGCRSLFFNLDCDPAMGFKECPCPLNALIPVPGATA